MVYFYERRTSIILNDLNDVDGSFSTLNDNNFNDFFLYGNYKFVDKKSQDISFYHKIH